MVHLRRGGHLGQEVVEAGIPFGKPQRRIWSPARDGSAIKDRGMVHETSVSPETRMVLGWDESWELILQI